MFLKLLKKLFNLLVRCFKTEKKDTTTYHRVDQTPPDPTRNPVHPVKNRSFDSVILKSESDSEDTQTPTQTQWRLFRRR